MRSSLPAPIRTGRGYASLAESFAPLVTSVSVNDYDKTKPSYRRAAVNTEVIAYAGGASSTLIGVAQQEEDDTTNISDKYGSMQYPPVDVGIPMQVPQSGLIINPVPIYISLDSRDRDRTVWAQPNRFRVPFVSSSTNVNVKATGERIRNVYSIALLSCVVPNNADVFDQPYLLLQIDEIEGIYDAANTSTTNALTKLYFREPGASTKFLRLDKAVGDPTTRIYWPAPKASLEQLTVSFRNYDGTLFDFGADTTPPTDPDTMLQTTLTLEIRTYVVDTYDTVGHRNPN